MEILKRLFVGSLVILMSTTSLIVVAEVNENNHILSLNAYLENSLGTFTIVHLPKGRMTVNYSPPEDYPTYRYEFPEDENGYVHMNFTLNVSHRLGKPKNNFPASWIWHNNFRFTGITLLITYGYEDYCYINDLKVCINETFEEYEIYISSCEPLFTNGSQVTCGIYISAWPGITPIRKIQSFYKSLYETLFGHTLDWVIIITPI